MAREKRLTANFGFDMMGADFYGTVEFEYLPGEPESYSARHGWNPGFPAECTPLRIWLQLDLGGGKLGPLWEISGALFELVADLQPIIDEMHEEAREDEEREAGAREAYEERRHQEALERLN